MISDLAEQTNQAPTVSTDRIHFGHILVGIDLSTHAVRVLEAVVLLAQQFQAHITIVHAVPPDVFDTDGGQASREAVAAGRDADEKELAHLVDKTPGLKDLQWQTVIEYGEPTNLINRISRDENADLIVLGSHGASGLERLALGSVAEAVLRQTMCPVLIIGPDCQVEQHLFGSILYATDLKTTGLRSAQYAVGLAKQFHGELTILHVQSRSLLSSGVLYKLSQNRVLHRLKQLLPLDIDQFCKTKVRYELGDPSVVITAAVRAECASLLVVGAKGPVLSDHAPWSVLSHIVRDARCPVLGIVDHLPKAKNDVTNFRFKVEVTK